MMKLLKTFLPNLYMMIKTLHIPSPSDNNPHPPPPSSNPPPRTPYPPHNSSYVSPRADDAIKGEINQDMAITAIRQPESEPEPRNADNQPETNGDYEGFLDMHFMTQIVAPLNIIYLDTLSNGKIPRGTQN
ncbi:unnamed protein product [Lactuca saligna]|uniref:Uncharacterized protein n=1 Tax=Lactuca saligna TaxID=75948 RepID=A0AA36EBQ7_LACSI|nr:unnamed protein product [Lactuca saligna]